MSAGPVLYTAAEAAAKVGQSKNWMMTKARKRLIPHTRIGRTPMWTDAHIAEIARMGEQRPRLALDSKSPGRKSAAKGSTEAKHPRLSRKNAA